MTISIYSVIAEAVFVLMLYSWVRTSIVRLSAMIEKQNQAIQSIASVCKRLQDRLDTIDREIELRHLPSWMK